MDSLANWAWWIIAGGVLLSPAFAFLLAIMVEILLGLLAEAGMPALFALIAAGVIGRMLIRKIWVLPRATDLVGDQA